MCDIYKEKLIYFKSVDSNSLSTINIKLKFQSIDDIEMINVDEYNNLIIVKNKIDELENCKEWDRGKKISNNYELIYLPNKKMKSNSVSKYEPLSRSYFKLWELISDFNLLNINHPIKIATLAEGPGGFIEAIINFRKKYQQFCKKDVIMAITLKSIDKDIPGWSKASNFLKKNQNVTISYGKDGTGNIYNVDNIKHFASKFNRDVSLVTADGGFDFSTNFNKQEQCSLRIIFCEIVTALSVQKKGGTFICKLYDTYTKISISYLYLLHCLYDCIYLSKPLTSRPANSEKYVICKGFKGISDELLSKLYVVIQSWEVIESTSQYVSQIIDHDTIPNHFIEKMKTYNTTFFYHQVKNIEKTLSIINDYYKIENYEQSKPYNNILKNQIYLAFNWCKKYKCKINYDSDYLNTPNNKKKIKII